MGFYSFEKAIITSGWTAWRKYVIQAGVDALIKKIIRIKMGFGVIWDKFGQAMTKIWWLWIFIWARSEKSKSISVSLFISYNLCKYSPRIHMIKWKHKDNSMQNIIRTMGITMKRTRMKSSKFMHELATKNWEHCYCRYFRVGGDSKQNITINLTSDTIYRRTLLKIREKWWES